MKKIITKYNGAFGYIKSYLLVAGALGGIAGIVVSILALFGAYEMDDNPLTMIVTGLLALLIAVAMYMWARKKCPLGMRKTLLRDMILVGLFAAVLCVFLIVIWLFKLIFHTNSSSAPTEHFASSYRRYGDDNYCYLWSVNGTHALLKDEGGNLIEVWAHGNDGLVTDGAGTLYRPE